MKFILNSKPYYRWSGKNAVRNPAGGRTSVCFSANYRWFWSMRDIALCMDAYMLMLPSRHDLREQFSQAGDISVVGAAWQNFMSV